MNAIAQKQVNVVLNIGNVVKATVLNVKGGWTSVRFEDGTTQRVRNSFIKPISENTEMNTAQTETPAEVTADNAAAPAVKLTAEQKAEAKATKDAEKAEAKAAAKLAKEAAKVARPVIPAHFVGDLDPNKTIKVGKAVVSAAGYFVSEEKTATGRRTIDNNDVVAQQLRAAPLETVYETAAKELGIEIDLLKAQYSHLNIGMQRMNLGNRIRGAAGALAARLAKEASAAAREKLAADRLEARTAKEAAAAKAKAEKAEAVRIAKEAKTATPAESVVAE